MEEEIYSMIEDGYTVEDIADELGISEDDVMDIIDEDYEDDYY
jgi:DNA-binding NarL/FixJ family response regulator